MGTIVHIFGQRPHFLQCHVQLYLGFEQSHDLDTFLKKDRKQRSQKRFYFRKNVQNIVYFKDKITLIDITYILASARSFDCEVGDINTPMSHNLSVK